MILIMNPLRTGFLENRNENVMMMLMINMCVVHIFRFYKSDCSASDSDPTPSFRPGHLVCTLVVLFPKVILRNMELGWANATVIITKSVLFSDDTPENESWQGNYYICSRDNASNLSHVTRFHSVRRV